VLLLPLIALTFPEFVRDLTTMGISGWLPVLFLALLPTFLGYTIWFRALARLPAASAAAYIYASTLVAVIGGVLVLQESLTTASLVGGAMVIVGGVAAQRFGRRWSDPRRSIACSTSAAPPSWASGERSGSGDLWNGCT